MALNSVVLIFICVCNLMVMLYCANCGLFGLGFLVCGDIAGGWAEWLFVVYLSCGCWSLLGFCRVLILLFGFVYASWCC